MSPRRRGFTDDVTVAGYKLASLAARSLPEPLAIAGAGGLGFAFSRFMVSRRAMVRRHLRRVRPELRGLALERAVVAAFDSYARYYVESFRLPALTAAEVDAAFSYEGFGPVDAALARGNGVVVVVPHLGSWEWAGRWIADRGIPITVVVEALDPPELFEWFADFRRSLGMNIVPLGPGAGAEVAKALRANHLVCLLADRDLERSGVPVTFFGEVTTLPAGPATLALRTGAELVVCAVYFRGRTHHHAVVSAPIPVERTEAGLRADVARLTQQVAGELERAIRVAPEQWHLFQPNWPSDPGYHDAAPSRR